MIELAEYIYFGSIAGIVGLSSFGAGIGQGITGNAAIKAMNIQPQARTEISRLALMGMALIDTASILCLTVALMMIFTTDVGPETLNSHIAHLGVLFALSIPSFIIGIVSALPAKYALLSAARQPFFSAKISRFMLICQSVIQTPAIFGFIVALLISSQSSSVIGLVDAFRLVAMGLTIGLGTLGPVIGLGLFSKSACKGLGLNREAYQKLLSLTLVSNAIIETPVILSMVVAFAMLGESFSDTNILGGIRVFASALCMGLSTLGTGISSGKTSAIACNKIAEDPQTYGAVSRTSLFAQGLIDTCAIYGLLVALMIMWLIK